MKTWRSLLFDQIPSKYPLTCKLLICIDYFSTHGVSGLIPSNTQQANSGTVRQVAPDLWRCIRVLQADLFAKLHCAQYIQICDIVQVA